MAADEAKAGPAASEPRPAPAPAETESDAAAATPADGAAAPRASFLGPIRVPPVTVRVAIGVLAVGVMTTALFLLVTEVLVPALGAGQGAGASAAAATVAAEPLPGEQFVIDEIIVNPAGTQGRRFLRLGVALESAAGEAGAATMSELETRKAQVRDLFILEFSQRTLDELTDPTVREELRVACTQKINAILVKGRVDNLYFTDYVLQ
jgi:flagellar basal body-associated protein FliL